MKQQVEEYKTLEKLSETIKQNIDNRELCKKLIMEALIKYPDAPQPQNLLGILAEYNHDQILAMKHYRASWALASNYRPAKENIDRLVDMHYSNHYFFTDCDCDNVEKNTRLNHIMHRKFGQGDFI